MGGIGSKNKYWQLELEPPLEVRLEDLSLVTIKFILVPRYDYQKDEERLLGTDFIHERYTAKFSMYDDEYQM